MINIKQSDYPKLGVFSYLIPFLLISVDFKCLAIVYEPEDWWTKIGYIGMMLSVTSFAVAYCDRKKTECC